MFSLKKHYALHSEQIYQFIYFLTFDKELTEDLLQETFIRAYEGRANYRGDANVLFWLRSIAKNLTYDYFKRKKLFAFCRLILFLNLKRSNSLSYIYCKLRNKSANYMWKLLS